MLSFKPLHTIISQLLTTAWGGFATGHRISWLALEPIGGEKKRRWRVEQGTRKQQDILVA